MAVYFNGRRQVSTFSQFVDEDGRERLDWEVSEEWIDIDQSTTARCGMPGSCTVEKSVGVSEKTSQMLKDVIGGTFGVKDVWSLKAEVESAIGHEVNWDTAVKSTKTFQFQAPKCGRYSLTVYRLQRTYQVSYLRKKWFSWNEDAWAKKWTRVFVEDTNSHDVMPDVEEHDPQCRCPPPPSTPRFDGYLAFDFGRVGLRAPYRLTEKGFDAQLGTKIVAVTVSSTLLANGLDHGLTATLSKDLLPDLLVFLGDLDVDIVEARMSRVLETGAIDTGEILPAIGRVSVMRPVELESEVRDQPLER